MNRLNFVQLRAVNLLAAWLTIASVLLAGCEKSNAAFSDSSVEPAPSQVGFGSRLAVFFASDVANESHDAAPITLPDGQTVYRSPVPVVVDSDVERARLWTGSWQSQTDPPRVSLYLKEDAKQALKEISARHVDDRALIYWDGSLVMAPVLRSAVSNVLIVFDGQTPVTYEMLQDAAKHYNGIEDTAD